MATISQTRRELHVKIVYYGPEGAGKRRTLQYMFDRVRPSLRGDFATPVSDGELLYFDFSPFDHPVFGDYRIRFHLYTLPGSVPNPAVWKMMLKKVDGIVVVIDGAPERQEAARESIRHLHGYLEAYGTVLEEIPHIVQVTMPVEMRTGPPGEVAARCGLPDAVACYADTHRGDGVLEVISRLSRSVMDMVGSSEVLRSAEGAEEDVKISDRVAGGPVCTSQADAPAAVPEMAVCEDSVSVELLHHEVSCVDGMLRVPLEIVSAGSVQRYTLSLAISRT